MKRTGRFYKKRVPERNILSVKLAVKKSAQDFNKIAIIFGLAITSLFLVGYSVNLALKSFMRTAFYQSQDFRIRQIDVKVNGSLTSAEILKWAKVKQGQNILALNLEQVREDLLKIPYISKATVERKMPDALYISIEERQPLALIQPKSTKAARLVQNIYYVDVNGIVMKPKLGEDIKHLPVITGMKSDFVTEGQRIEHPETLSALNFIRKIEFSNIKAEVDLNQIDVELNGYIVVRTSQNGLIRFRTDYLDQQIKRLEIIFDFAQREHKIVRTADLSPERNVPVTFKNSMEM
jgi:cell division protein FtsQ